MVDPLMKYENERLLVCALVVSPVVTIVSAIVSLACTMFFVPRRSTGNVEVPDVSWPAYVFIGNGLAIGLSLLVLGWIYRSRRERVLAWLTAAVFLYLAHATFLTTLLRRDFIGKL